MQVTVTEAKANLSKLLALVRAGEEIIITKFGVPVAKLVAITPERRRRKLGKASEKIYIAPDFDDPLAISPKTQRRKPGRLAGKASIGPDFNDPLPNEMLAEFEN